MANLLELQDLLKGAAMADVRRVASGTHPTVHEAWMGVDEVKRRLDNMKAAEAEKSEEGIQEPAMVDQYLAVAQQLEGPPSQMAQSPMNGFPGGRPPMGQQAMGPPRMGPPQGGQPPMGPPQMGPPGRMAELSELSHMAHMAQQPPSPRRPMPRRPPMAGGPGIRQLAAGGGLIRGYDNGGDVYAGIDQEALRRAMQTLQGLPPEEWQRRRAEIAREFGLPLTVSGVSPEVPTAVPPVAPDRSIMDLYEPVTDFFGNLIPGPHAVAGKRMATKDVPGAPTSDVDLPIAGMGAPYDVVAASTALPKVVGDEEEDGAPITPEQEQLTGLQAKILALQEKLANKNADPATGELRPLEEIIMQNIQKDEEAETKQKKFNAWQALAMGGAKAMASQSPYALSALGEGAAAGLGSFAKAQNVDEAQRGKSLDRAILMASVLSKEDGPLTFLEWQEKTWPKLAKEMGFMMESLGKDPEALIKLQREIYEMSYGPMLRRGGAASGGGTYDALVKKMNLRGGG